MRSRTTLRTSNQDRPYLLDLLPDRWAVAHPQSVRQHRIEEKETVSDAKRWRRAQSRPGPRRQAGRGPVVAPRESLDLPLAARLRDTCLSRTITLLVG